MYHKTLSYNTSNYLTYRYPFIEIILGLATVFIHDPQGHPARVFCQSHPQAAKAIFRSPESSLLLCGESDSSLNISVYPSPSSCEWEVMSRTSKISRMSDHDPEPITPIQLTSTIEVPPVSGRNADDELEELDIYASDGENCLSAPKLKLIPLPDVSDDSSVSLPIKKEVPNTLLSPEPDSDPFNQSTHTEDDVSSDDGWKTLGNPRSILALELT
jgi:hypothetical protein